MTGPSSSPARSCAVCGREHDELEPAFLWPDAVFAVPEEERGARAHLSNDFVAIDGKAFFIRCVLPIPVTGRQEPYCWGFWVKVPRADFDAYRASFRVDPPRDHPGFQGTLANQTHLAPPTLGLRVHVTLGRGTHRPRLMLLDDAHPFAGDQTSGVSEAQVHAWSESASPEDPLSPRRDPPKPRFDPTLEVDGWLVATPEEVGRELLPLAAPPRPGDSVKAPFVFLAADEHGNVEERVELMWIALDEVGRDGWWSGTLDNHPFRPAPLDAGTRVWLSAAHVLAHRPDGDA